MLEELWAGAPEGAHAFVGALKEVHNYPIRDAVARAASLQGEPDLIVGLLLLQRRT